MYRTEDPLEGKERFLQNIDFSIQNKTLGFYAKDKFTKVDAKIFVPKKDYFTIYVKLFNGPITGEFLKVENLDFRTTNGQIRLISSEGEKADIETANGSITISGNTFFELEAETMNGKVDVDGYYKKADLESLSGTITAFLPQPEKVSYHISSVTGSIYVKVPKDAAVSGEAKSNLGNVHIHLEPLYKMEDKKEVLQKIIHFDTTSELIDKSYIFADSKTGSVFIQPM